MERLFLLTPLREGRPTTDVTPRCSGLFLLTPLREGRLFVNALVLPSVTFLLTPLREGRRAAVRSCWRTSGISTHAPAGGATENVQHKIRIHHDFYSRPCGRGDGGAWTVAASR